MIRAWRGLVAAASSALAAYLIATAFQRGNVHGAIDYAFLAALAIIGLAASAAALLPECAMRVCLRAPLVSAAIACIAAFAGLGVLLAEGDTDFLALERTRSTAVFAFAMVVSETSTPRSFPLM